jgi:hypothetical protein
MQSFQVALEYDCRRHQSLVEMEVFPVSSAANSGENTRNAGENSYKDIAYPVIVLHSTTLYEMFRTAAERPSKYELWGDQSLVESFWCSHMEKGYRQVLSQVHAYMNVSAGLRPPFRWHSSNFIILNDQGITDQCSKPLLNLYPLRVRIDGTPRQRQY